MSKNVSFSYEDLARRMAQQASVPLTLDIYEWSHCLTRNLPEHG